MTTGHNAIRMASSLVALAASASCVPTGYAGNIAPVAAIAPPETPSAEVEDRAARDRFWRRAAKLLVPVSTVPAAPFDDQATSSGDRQRSLDCLTSAVYHEARSEPADGQRAVAQVYRKLTGGAPGLPFGELPTPR